MANETKVGVAVFTVLLGVFGFVLYRKYDDQLTALAALDAGAAQAETPAGDPLPEGEGAALGALTDASDTGDLSDFSEAFGGEPEAPPVDPDPAGDAFAAVDFGGDPLAEPSVGETPAAEPAAVATAAPETDLLSGWGDPPAAAETPEAPAEDAFADVAAWPADPTAVAAAEPTPADDPLGAELNTFDAAAAAPAAAESEPTAVVAWDEPAPVAAEPVAEIPVPQAPVAMAAGTTDDFFGEAAANAAAPPEMVPFEPTPAAEEPTIAPTELAAAEPATAESETMWPTDLAPAAEPAVAAAADPAPADGDLWGTAEPAPAEPTATAAADPIFGGEPAAVAAAGEPAAASPVLEMNAPAAEEPVELTFDEPAADVAAGAATDLWGGEEIADATVPAVPEPPAAEMAAAPAEDEGFFLDAAPAEPAAPATDTDAADLAMWDAAPAAEPAAPAASPLPPADDAFFFGDETPAVAAETPAAVAPVELAAPTAPPAALAAGPSTPAPAGMAEWPDLSTPPAAVAEPAAAPVAEAPAALAAEGSAPAESAGDLTPAAFAPDAAVRRPAEANPVRTADGERSMPFRFRGPKDLQVAEVQPGESYWIISKRAYGAAKYFKALARYNALRIRDPRNLQPGMKVICPPPSVLLAYDTDLAAEEQAARSRSASSGWSGFAIDDRGRPVYMVAEGDTIGDIAQQHLGRYSRWEQIFALNRDKIRDPNRLKPGTLLDLPADAAGVRRTGGRTR